ncbi:MAG: chaperone modulator CbpM [Rhodovibrionaceae bacterium]|nr:chaperone modulator CbpM [Rhodovibrionaceae bacterium]
MPKTLDEIAQEVAVTEVELTTWIEQQWVLPAEEAGAWVFDETDVARIKLIAELRRDLDVNDEAVPLVLNLLDQVYDLRRRMQDLQAAINGLSDPAREELEAQLRDLSEN